MHQDSLLVPILNLVSLKNHLYLCMVFKIKKDVIKLSLMRNLHSTKKNMSSWEGIMVTSNLLVLQ